MQRRSNKKKKPRFESLKNKKAHHDQENSRNAERRLVELLTVYSVTSNFFSFVINYKKMHEL